MKINSFLHHFSFTNSLFIMIFMMISLLGPGVASCQHETRKVNNPAFQTTIDQLISHSVSEMEVQEIMDPEDFIFLDAREYQEYQVSHIPGAIWVGYEDFAIERVESVSLDQKIVVYCSVGYRSEKIGEKLEANGYQDVRNLYGGIFEWVNQDKPVVNSNEEQTKKVHAYDQLWGIWLENGEKIYD